MFHRIVVGVDGSQGGDDALALARALAEHDAELLLVTAVPIELRAPLRASEGDDPVTAAAREMLVAAAGDDPRARTIVEHDISPGRALHEVAEAEHADLIVVGRSHRGAAGRIVLGDTSRTTLHGAPCPVAIAPEGYREAAAPIQAIGVAANDSDGGRAAVALAAAIAERSGARLHLATVIVPPALFATGYGVADWWTEYDEGARRLAADTLERFAAQSPGDVTTEVREGATGPELDDVARTVDLLVVGSRGWGTARSVVLGSTSDHLAHHAACPVLIAPRPADAATSDDSDAVRVAPA